jgi:hypothetical protein
VYHAQPAESLFWKPGLARLACCVTAPLPRVIFFSAAMIAPDIAQYIAETFAGVETATNFGYTFFFYGGDHKLPFATLATSDNEYDSVSNLDRPDVFRLNLGITKESFRSLFGTDAVDGSAYDYTALDRLMPHPHYAGQHFICVLNPGRQTLERVKELLAEAFDLARARSARRTETDAGDA